MKAPKGYIKQATYQKLVEENKKLLADIRVLALYPNYNFDDFVVIRKKWLEIFRKEQNLQELLKEIGKQHFK